MVSVFLLCGIIAVVTVSAKYIFINNCKKMMNDNYLRSLAFWTTSFYYFSIVENCSHETISHGNQHVIVTENILNSDDYEYQTRWSDFNIIVPLLFNFYHGAELLLKGFVLLKSNEEDERLNHNLTQLYEKFKRDYPAETELIRVLKKYLSSTPSIEPLKSFFQDNRIGVNKFYDVLKYPQNKEGSRNYSHLTLKYRGDICLEFLETLKDDIGEIKRLSVIIGNSFRSTT